MIYKNKHTIKRNQKTKPISALITDIAKPLFKKKNIQIMRLLLEWPTIVGKEYSQNSTPEKIFFNTTNGLCGKGVLTLKINERLAFEYQHLTPVIIERVNQFFGFKAIERVILKKSPTPQSQSAHNAVALPKNNPSEEQLASIEETLHDLPCELKDTLREIGIHLKRITLSKNTAKDD
jgi:hypothetical protein